MAMVFMSIMETLDDHWEVSIFKHWKWSSHFWNKSESWDNKYYHVIVHPEKWYQIIYNYLWESVLTPFTCGWHLTKAFMQVSFILAIITYTGFKWMDVVIYPVIHFITFELFYSRILKWK